MAPDPLTETPRAFGARNPDPPSSLLISVAPYKKESSYAATCSMTPKYSSSSKKTVVSR